MSPNEWRVGIVCTARYECKIVIDMLRSLGVGTLTLCADNAVAASKLDLANANLIISTVKAGPTDALTWVQALRRDVTCSARKAPIVLIGNPITAQLVNQCKNAGVNALIGQPFSTTVFVALIKKVLANPRPFIECESYVGPCRRAGIHTATNARRRRSDQAVDGRIGTSS